MNKPYDAQETYLGDGLYAAYDGFYVWLRAPRENGDHIVGMDPSVLDNFERFVQAMRQPVNKETDTV